VRIIDAVHAALVEGLKIPDRTITIRFIAHEGHRFTADGRRDERFILITIDLFSGRSIEAKQRLYAAMVKNLAEFDIPCDHVKVLLREAPRENWGIGGVPASAISLGYEIEV
jgi:phenylpyruvate tautomerase PptA (4-oxalocrotonate tautomerase family)